MEQDKYRILKQVIEEAIPFNREMGLRLDFAEEGKAGVSFDFQEKLVGNFLTRILHGGVISAVLDVVGACAVMSTFSRDDPLYGMGTVDLRIDYLLPGSGERFRATGQVMRPGRILSSTRMELYNDKDELLAIGTAIYRASRKVAERPPNI